MNYLKIRKAVAVITVFLLMGSVFSEDVSNTSVVAENTVQKKVLTLSDAVELASQNNISVQRSKLELETLKRAKNTAWNSASPSITASAGYTRPNDTDSYDYSTYIQGGVNVALSPSVYTSIKTARLNYENGQITYSEAIRSVELSVRKMFYGLLYEKENIALQQRNLETARKQYAQNQDKYNRGQISELDALTSQVNYEKLKPAVESAQVTFSNDMAAFKQALGLDQKNEVEISGSLDDVLNLKTVTLPSTASTAPSVQQKENAVKIAETSLLASRFSAYGPTASASWTIGKSKTSTDVGDTTANTGTLSLGVSIPLDGVLPWSSRAVAVQNAKTNAEDARLQLENQKTTAAVQTESYLRQIQQLQAQIPPLQANADLAQKSYDMTLAAYNHGAKDLLSLQSASDALLTAQVSLKSQAYTLVSAILNLESTIGVPFGTLGK